MIAAAMIGVPSALIDSFSIISDQSIDGPTEGWLAGRQV